MQTHPNPKVPQVKDNVSKNFQNKTRDVQVKNIREELDLHYEDLYKIKIIPYIFKNKEVEKNFVEYFYGKYFLRLILLSVAITLVMIIWFPLEFYLKFVEREFQDTTRFVLIMIFRFGSILNFVFLIPSLFFKRVRKNAVLVEFIVLGILLTMVTFLIPIQYLAARQGSSSTNAARIMMLCFASLIFFRLRVYANFIYVVYSITWYLINTIFFYFTNFIDGTQFHYQIFSSLFQISTFHIVVLMISMFFEINLRDVFTKSSKLQKSKCKIQQEIERTSVLLHNIFPPKFVSRLIMTKQQERFFWHYKNMNVFLADLVEFTEYSTKVSPRELVDVMNELYTSFDRIVIKFGQEKIKTIGDALLVCDLSNHGTYTCLLFAFSILEELKKMNSSSEKFNFEARIGVSKNDCFLVCLGEKMNFDLYGDAVEQVMFLEEHSETNCINISTHVRDDLIESLGAEYVKNHFILTKRTYESVLDESFLIKMNKTELEMEKVSYTEEEEENRSQFHKIERNKDQYPTSSSDTNSSSSITNSSKNSFGSSQIIPTTTTTTNNFLKINFLFLFFQGKKKSFKSWKEINWEYIERTYQGLSKGYLKMSYISFAFQMLFISGSFVAFNIEHASNLGVIGYYSITLVSVCYSSLYLIVTSVLKNSKKLIFLGVFCSVLQKICCVGLLIFVFFVPREYVLTSRIDEWIPVMFVSNSFFLYNILPYHLTVVYSVLSMTIFYIFDIIYIKFYIESFAMGLTSVSFCAIAAYYMHFLLLKNFKMEKLLSKNLKFLRKEKSMNESILSSSFPKFVLDRLESGTQQVIYDNFDDGCILFAKINDMALLTNEKRGPFLTIQCLNDVFGMMDKICQRHKCVKIKSIYDTYILINREGSLDNVLQCSFLFIKHSKRIFKKYGLGVEDSIKEDIDVGIKIGVLKGKFVGGIVGNLKRLFDVFGQSCNLASRMCCLSQKNRVLTCCKQLDLDQIQNKNDYLIQKRGILKVKGKGDVETYWINQKNKKK